MQKTDLVTGLLHRTYLAVSPQTTVLTARAHGIDLSKYDLGFDRFSTDKQIDFVALRTSYRLTKDQLFDTLLAFIQSVPIRIAYHYYNFGYSGDGTWQDQVNFMIPLVRGNGFHATAWDFEEAFNVMSQTGAINSYYAIQELEQRLGLPCFLYTSLGLYNSVVYPTGLDWNKVKLWLAQWLYTPDPNKNPSVPKGRTGRYWDIWQYTDQGTGYGTVRNYPTDLNVFNGTPDEMKTLLNISGTTTPPPTGEMMYYKNVYGDFSIRDVMDYEQSKVVGTLHKDDIVEGVLITNVPDTITQWVAFSKVYRADGSVDVFAQDVYCSGYTKYMMETIFTPPVDPPAAVADMPYTLILGGKYPDGTDSPYQETIVTGIVKAK